MIYIINDELCNGDMIVTDYSFENIEDHFDDYCIIIENFVEPIYGESFDCVYLLNNDKLRINYIKRSANSTDLYVLMDNYEK